MSCDVWLAVVLWRLIGCYENQNVENGLRDTVDRSCDMLSVEVCQVWVWVSSKGSRCCLSKNRYHHWSVLVGFRNINGFMADLHKCWKQKNIILDFCATNANRGKQNFINIVFTPAITLSDLQLSFILKYREKKMFTWKL